MKKGSLILVGSGIKSVGHITLEAAGWIRESDVVLYCVADPATEIWIKDNSKHCIDLYALYGNDKKRMDTYNDMVEAMLKYLRQGKDVCGVFYGHPGVFVYPSHKAIEIARKEGYRAAMLPAISALDCLWADLGVDPSQSGSQTVEATDLLLRKRTLNSDCHVVIWQIGCVGDLGFNFAGYDGRNFQALVDYLVNIYGDDHEVTVYQASQYPVCAPYIETVPVSQLGEAKISGISTLYIPPKIVRQLDLETARSLGLVKKAQPAKANPPATSASAQANGKGGAKQPKPKTKEFYATYRPVPDQSGLATFIADVAQDPRMLAEFMRKPKVAAATLAELTPEESAALLSFHPGRIRMSMRIPKNSPYFEEVAKAKQKKTTETEQS
ncbi:MAG: SAM-dependent methyltransferase [Cyanobacteria bacterium P01_G01_bin.54]